MDFDQLGEKLREVFDRYRRKKKGYYDVLVGLSGGKDSTYVLYVCKKIYNLNVLAVSFDNGFQAPQARKNIENAVNKLNVGYISCKFSGDLMDKLYRYFLLKTGIFCPVCMRGIAAVTQKIQHDYQVPLRVGGCAPQTDEGEPREFMVAGNIKFFKQVIANEIPRGEVKDLIFESPVSRVRKRLESYPLINRVFDRVFPRDNSLSLNYFIKWDYDRIFRTIKNDLGWEEPPERSEHFDCVVYEMKPYLRQKKWDYIAPSTLKYSTLIRAGEMTREEALKKIAIEEANDKEPEIMDYFLERLNLTRQDIDEAVKDKLKHMRFL